MDPFSFDWNETDACIDDAPLNLLWDDAQHVQSMSAYIKQDPRDSLDSPTDFLIDAVKYDKTDDWSASPSPTGHNRPRRTRCWTEADRLRHRDLCKGKTRLSKLDKAAIINIWNSRNRDDRGTTTQVQIANIFGKSKSTISRLLRPFKSDADGDSADRGQAAASAGSRYHTREIAFSISAAAFGRSTHHCSLKLLMDQSDVPVNGLNVLLNYLEASLGLLRDSYHLCYLDEDEDEIVVTSDNELGIVISDFPSDRAVGLYLKGK
ncbi:hypothetical protein GUITHDRAFT_153102 [Guillardia theta CCMP2712]|uniref:PB1 domain-containing protein n=1 Tax=Guillardia theta (strain CCMP2712) TaxID=905079 RepID=L1J5Z3_GUITC|nr:hypothetical protein GUITHDRAFT_153102 [Guillardia theta CCMP2712]EKX43926.1 hypothetical protein GUITHDRAFT_153102 [Guillardia theta CCMP2712]|eukprot:XP_005830906.1 hypothetical protein GUITHDRAFT_153102 [Guillardia theta CCMP2712]